MSYEDNANPLVLFIVKPSVIYITLPKVTAGSTMWDRITALYCQDFSRDPQALNQFLKAPNLF